MRYYYPLLTLVFCAIFPIQSHAQQSFSLTGPAGRFDLEMAGTARQIRLTGLIPGHHYEVSLLPEATGCTVRFDHAGGSQVQSFQATQDIQVLNLVSSCASTIIVHISVSDTDAKILAGPTVANLTVSGGFTADELIQGVLIGNECSVNLNVTQIGEDVQFGTFSNGLTSIGFEHGIILSTGNIQNAPGPNNSASAGNNVPGNNSDPDLDGIASGPTYDAAVIEFDFTPVTNQIEFEYVFASEEYCEFVNKNYNDVFGFFISGPGISGSKNIARVPTTGEFVNIDNINHLKNSQFFNPNSNISCGATTNMTDIQFDGYTVPLKAVASVIPCQTYHLKLAIADVGDGIYDSAVFLKAGSFDAGDIVQVEPKSTIVQVQNAYEGCDNGYLLFDRSCSNDLNQPLTLTLNVLPASTAQAGTDYVPLPQTITIPAGQKKDSIPIIALDDGITEGDETLVVEVVGQYPCYKPTATITISDKIDFAVTGEQLAPCEGLPTKLSPGISGGIAPLTYQWSDGSTNPTLTLPATAAQTVTCTVTDVCNNTDTAIFDIQPVPTPTGQLTGGGVLCDENSTGKIALSFTGLPPWDVTVGRDGANIFTKTYTDTSSSFTINQAGTYELLNISSHGCSGTTNGQAVFVNSTLEVGWQKQDVSCHGGSDGKIHAVPVNGTAPFSFSWANSSADTAILDQLTAGNYQVTVTDGNDCTATADITVEEPDTLIFAVQDIQHVNCYTPQAGSITTTTSGGTPPYAYSWSQGSTMPDLQGLPAGTYTCVITDDNGCTAQLQAEVEGDFEKPALYVEAPDTVNCYHPEITISAFGSSTGPSFSYQWTTTGGHITSDSHSVSIQVDEGGLYLLTIQNIGNGCTADTAITVIADRIPPTVDAGTDKLLTCVDTIVSLGTPAAAPYFAYTWLSPNGHFVSATDQAVTTVDAGALYYLQVQNLQNGCTAMDTVQVTALQERPRNATLDITDPTCLGHDGQIVVSQVLGGSPPFVYSFDGGQSFYSDSIGTGLDAGHYEVIIQDVYGCEYRLNTNLLPPVPVTLNPQTDYFIELGDSVRLAPHASRPADELAAIEWSPLPDSNCTHCLDPVVRPMETTKYWLTVRDSLNCEAQAVMTVIVRDPDVFIPNVFSRKEGSFEANSSFTIFGDPRRISRIRQLIVYDRWGNQVYERRDFAPNDLSAGWDGFFRNKTAPSAVYVYFAEVEFINGKVKQYKGDVTLVR